jgi:hypothetical protein
MGGGCTERLFLLASLTRWVIVVVERNKCWGVKRFVS